MKMDRLIGIITILMNNEKVTAPYLAGKFEVSRRTINRDIEDICKAGIPIVTTQGASGGISIADGYKLDKSILTKDELQAVMTGLKSLESVSSVTYSKKLQDKLFSAKKKALPVQDTILIDLSCYHKSSLTEKIEAIKRAVQERRLISFRYYYQKGETERILEPYQIVFRWSAWYIFGYCPERKDFRMFKLSRLWDLQVTDKTYIQRSIPPEKLDFEAHFTNDISFVALFDPGEKYRLIDEYEKDCFTYSPDGRLRFCFSFTNKDNLLRWILSFGDRVEVISPPEIRMEIQQQAENILKKYKGT